MPISKKRKKKSGNKKKTVTYNPKSTANETNSLGLTTTLELMNRVKNKVPNVEFGPKHQVKVSDLLLDFGRDLMDDTMTLKEFENTVNMLVTVWNIGCLDLEKQEKAKQLLIKDFSNIPKENYDEFIELLNALIERKNHLYASYKYIIYDFTAAQLKNGDFYLQVASEDRN